MGRIKVRGALLLILVLALTVVPKEELVGEADVSPSVVAQVYGAGASALDGRRASVLRTLARR